MAVVRSKVTEPFGVPEQLGEFLDRIYRSQYNLGMNTEPLQIEGWVSVNRAAEILGCTVGRVRQLLGDGTIEGRKLDGLSVWMVSEVSVRKYDEIEFVGSRPRIGR